MKIFEYQMFRKLSQQVDLVKSPKDHFFFDKFDRTWEALGAARHEHMLLIWAPGSHGKGARITQKMKILAKVLETWLCCSWLAEFHLNWQPHYFRLDLRTQWSWSIPVPRELWASKAPAALASASSTTVWRCCSRWRSGSRRSGGQTPRYPAHFQFPVRRIPNLRDLEYRN